MEEILLKFKSLPSIHALPSTSPQGRQCRSSHLRAMTHCHPSLWEVSMSHRQGSPPRVSGRRVCHPSSQSSKDCRASQLQMQRWPLQPTTTCSLAPKCHPLGVHKGNFRRRPPQSCKGQEWQHSLPPARLRRRSHTFRPSPRKSRPQEASSRPPIVPLPSKSDAKSEPATRLSWQRAVVLEGGRVARKMRGKQKNARKNTLDPKRTGAVGATSLAPAGRPSCGAKDPSCSAVVLCSVRRV